MRVNNQTVAAVGLLAISLCARAQVLSPAEITDPAISNLQKSYQAELHAITSALSGHQYPYRFYFSRKLDLTEREQQMSDQRSIQFDRFRGQVVLKITGNYFAAYSAERMTKEQRAKQTWQDVMLPILQAAVPALAKAEGPDAFALEVSHHVIRKVLGVDNEGVENFVMILPKASAQRLIAARDDAARDEAAADGTAYLNGVPISLWPGAQKQAVTVTAAVAPAPNPPAVAAVSKVAPPPNPSPAAALPRIPAPAPAAAVAPVTHPAGVPAKLDEKYRDVLAGMVKALDSQAHFVSYAPPSFIPFRGGVYLQIPITTSLPATAAGSQYKLAALAFDRHIVHLIRPMAADFAENDDFTGFNFSTTIRLAGVDADTASGESVEFLFSLNALRSYAAYDLTGQQLLDGGIVLINGERVGLDLQTAEGSGR